VRGPTSRRKAIATVRSASVRISTEPATSSNASSTRSSRVVASQRATTSLPPITSHSSSLRQSGCGSALMSPRPSTTLADLFTPLLSADLSSAVRASLRSWLNDEIDDGLAYGRQARLRRWTVDSFFSAPLVRDGDAGGMRKRSWS